MVAGMTPAASEIYASVVMDARNGKVLHSRHGNSIRYPASLTKMMTLYVAIEAVEAGEIGLDTLVTISRNAAAEPPSKIGFKPGQRKRLRHLMRAAAVRSANDAATAIAEAISGSEAAFAQRMTRTARAMGMKNTTFRNAHGLTQSGHRSTAHDMALLSRHVMFDYPEYFHLFSKRRADVGGRAVNSTNRNFLNNFSGADGIKTGFTSASMFNLAASARRGDRRLIVIVLGGRTVATRDAHVMELMNTWFRKMPRQVATRVPGRPRYPQARVAAAKIDSAGRRLWRPTGDDREDIGAIIASLSTSGTDLLADTTSRAGETQADAPLADPALPILPYPKPPRRPKSVALAHYDVTETTNALVELGTHSTRNAAQRRLMAAALASPDPLIGARKQVVRRNGKFVSRFIGITPNSADQTCVKLEARGMSCRVVFIR